MSTAFQENSHSFIVRVWLENRELSGAAPQWRAVVEHVPSGQRRYLRELADILPYIVSHLGTRE